MVDGQGDVEARLVAEGYQDPDLTTHPGFVTPRARRKGEALGRWFSEFCFASE